MKTAAFFDLDDTIVKGNSGMRTCMRYFLTGKTPFYNAFKVIYRYVFYWQGVRDPFRFFYNIYDFMSGKDYNEAKEEFAREFDRNLRQRIFKGARERIKWHKEQGHIVAIVTNSPEIMIEKVKDILGVSHLIATSLEVKKGKITGRTDRVSFGINKVAYIKEFARKHDIDLSKSYAYSDNTSDIYMLGAVGHPIATNPQIGMRRFAQKKKWKIIHFNETGA